MTYLSDIGWVGYTVTPIGGDTLTLTVTVNDVLVAEITQDPEELPDDQIVPDNTDPLPPDPEVKTDPVDDE